jgi:hypothetical protein
MKKIREIFERSNKKEPQLIKMDDDKIKYIMKSSKAQETRMKLVDIYLDDNVTFNDNIKEGIQHINWALQERDPNRSTCSYSSFTGGQ